MKLVFRYLKRHLGIFMLSTLFLTMEAMADLLQPAFMSAVVDEGVAHMDTAAILRYGLIMLLIAGVGAVSAVMRNHFSCRVSRTIGKEIRRDMYRKVQSLSLENIDRLRPASLITRLTNDVSQIQEFINSIMRMMVKAPITCIGAIALLILQTPAQAPVMAGILAVAFLLIFCNMKIGYPRFGKVQQKLDKLNGVSREFLSSVRVVKAFNAEDEEEEKFAEASAELAGANTSALRAMAMFTPLISLTVNFGVVVLLFISRHQDAAQIGRLMASVNYMTQVMFALNMMTHVLNTTVRAVASAERIEEVLEEQPAQTLPENPEKPQILGRIKVENLSFRYKGAGREALMDVDFTVEPGETLGIIGPTGSGKSTLVHLIPRLYDATEGRVLVDGTDVTKMDVAHLRSHVAVVMQKALLFSGTIEENLRWGKPDASFEELQEAARIACAEEFILETEKGYHSILGQGGVNLSGGQKQRLSLARALLRKPSILILDDCTSALDAQTEAKVLSGLREQSGQRTVLLISQRISTVMKADRILCLDGGRVQGLGTHRQLMESCDTYRAIYASQIGGEENV